MSGKLILSDVLFGYEDVESKLIYIVSEDDGLNITYELNQGKNVIENIPKSIFGVTYGHTKINTNKNFAIWLGASNDTVLKNGKNAKYGDFFKGANGTSKRKLTENELDIILSDEYHFEA